MTSLSWSLREGTVVGRGDRGMLVVQGGGREVAFDPGCPEAEAVLGELGRPGEDSTRLALPASAATAGAILARLAGAGLVARTVVHDGRPLASLIPIAPSFAFANRRIRPDERYQLSRFAYVRSDHDTPVVECPLSHARIHLYDWRASAIVHVLARACGADEVSAGIPNLTPEPAGGVMSLLLDAGMLQELDEDGTLSEDRSPSLLCWEFHDLLFHSRSRAGRHDNPMGATCRLAGTLPPPPALRRGGSNPSIPLPRPDLERIEREDPPFAAVQEARRSIREYAARPISDAQLGEFLYRVGRVADYLTADVPTPRGPVRIEQTPRPYPAAGALYELDLYLAINACEDVPSGLYFYDAELHRLDRVTTRTTEVLALLADAGRAARIPADRLQVLLIVSARFSRIAWKYASIAYALTLKHVGVVYQTMYLAATAMGLAPCALGMGDSDLFARAAGKDVHAESSVGEFLLGRREG